MTQTPDTTEDLTKLPDFPALQQLARALWRNGSVRGAALLVGAGFSKNVIRPGVDTPTPPLWTDLLRDLKEQLYPDDPNRAPTNPLRIAEEYRTYFGQAALDDFIRTRFPDRAWSPGPLHSQLLDLPWSDVLTTNWDTLLERAAEDAIEYTYEVVRSEADLPHSRPPRIVKLHGTIGDFGPLIFAEEDYRTYPAKHAAFVNLARQVFIENELCLLGFSGEDPNFLQWAGWVRDQLGGKARRIYLVGNLDLPRATRKFLEAHNVAPIDFAPAVKKLAQSERHAAATRLFFEALSAAKPVPSHEWKRTPVSDYPLHVGGIDAHARARKDDQFAAEALEKMAVLLRSDRESYPGWLVCPRNTRVAMGYSGEDIWVLRKSVLDLLDLGRRAEILFELVWCRTISFSPLRIPLRDAVTALLEIPDPAIALNTRLNLALALMREARMASDRGSLDRWGDLLDAEDPEVTAVSSFRTEAQYQRCLWARDRMDHHSLAAGLAKLDADDSVWKMRRAALYTEIGDFVKASRLIREAATELDKRHRLDRSSLWIKSRLGWANWLCRGADSFPRSTDSLRPREFKESLIDPLQEIEGLEYAADEIRQRRQEDTAEVTPNFDAGTYRPGPGAKQVAPGDDAFGVFYELDQLIETVGLPIHINHVGICSAAATSVVRVTYQRNVDWYVWLLRSLHSHFDKAFIRNFGRIAIAQLPNDVSIELVKIVDRAISFWTDRFKLSQAPELKEDHGRAIDRLRLLLVAQSHLTLRMSEEDAIKAFRLALNMARDPLIFNHWLLEAIGELATYAAQAISTANQSEMILSVLEFPLSTEKGANSRSWPQPIHAIWNAEVRRPQGDPQWEHRIMQLIAAAGTGLASREEALLRLAYLAIRKALTGDERSRLAVALWSQVDAQENALPAETSLLPSTFIELPSPDGINAVERVDRRLFDVDMMAIMALPGPIDSREIQEKLNFLVSIQSTKSAGLTLDSARAVKLFDQIVKYRSPAIEDSDSFMANFSLQFHDGVRLRSGWILANILVPAMDVSDRTEARGRELLDFLVLVRAWPGLAALPYFIINTPGLSSDVVSILRRGLFGSGFHHVSSAALALAQWGKLVRQNLLAELPRNLINQLIANIEMRQEAALHTLLSVASTLLADNFLDANDISRLVQALSELRVETRYDEVKLDTLKAVSISFVRVECAKLAIALRSHTVDDGTLQAWIDEARSDPLPEVRFSVADA